MKKFAAIFDMDGVIVDSNPAHKIAIQQFCKKYGFKLSEVELRTKIYGRQNRDWITKLFDKELETEELKKYADEKEKLFREIYEKDIVALSGIETFLKHLDEHGIKKAIATSAPIENVDFTLEKTSLRKYFDTIIDDSQVKTGKPNPEVYLKAAEAVGLPPANCIVFEDSLAGIESGKKAGCKVVGVLTTHSKEELINTDLTISDFNDLDISDLEKLFA